MFSGSEPTLAEVARAEACCVVKGCSEGQGKLESSREAVLPGGVSWSGEVCLSATTAPQNKQEETESLMEQSVGSRLVSRLSILPCSPGLAACPPPSPALTLAWLTSEEAPDMVVGRTT